MWNSRKYTAMAVLCAGLAVAAATPSSAQSWGGAYGYAGCCGASGSGPASYAGVYTYGWPYGVIGDVGCPAYGDAGGGAYGYAGGYASGLGYGAYGYAGGYGLTVTSLTLMPAAAAVMVLTPPRRFTVSPVPARRGAITAMAVMLKPAV